MPDITFTLINRLRRWKFSKIFYHSSPLLKPNPERRLGFALIEDSATAAPKRVWRALTVPSECLAWDKHILSALDPIET
jgi:hypothetical protein